MDAAGLSNAKKLNQATAFLKAGKKERAYSLLREILLKDKNSLPAWELLSQATNHKAERVYCLKQILKIQPGHAWARKELEQLEPPGPPAETGAAAVQGSAELKAGLLNGWGLSSPPTQAPLRSSPASQDPLPDTQPRTRKRRKIPLILYFTGALGVLCVGIWAYYLLVLFGNTRSTPSLHLTQTAAALQQANCQDLINKAMQAAGNSCDKVGGNSVCYGNFTLQSQLLSGSSAPFSQRGDIIKIEDLQQLSASALNISKNQWGIAIFKVMANLPRSLPGETVTLMLFGNTTLDNQSPSLESFYFSSQVGEITCDQVPFDGITIDVPEGSGVKFQINGTELTLTGNASLTANKGGNMDVSLYSGSAKIVANGQEQYFGAGQKVSVTLGGDNGMQAVSGPSAPVPLSLAELHLACTMYGKYCSNTQITPVSVEDARATNLAAFATSTLTQTNTWTPTNSPTRVISVTPSTTPSPTLTGSPTRTPTASRTPTHTATRTRTKTPTQTATTGGTVAPTTTLISSNTPTATVISTPTPSATMTSSLTATPGNTPTDTQTGTPTNIPTSTPSFTPSNSPTATNIPSMTYTPTITPSPIPVVVVNIMVPPVDGSQPTHSETNFEADAWDTAVGTGNGDGINHVNFWFSGPSDLGFPAGSPHTEFLKPFCAFGNLGTCNIMPGGIWGSLPGGTYTMYVQAVGVSGPSAVATITFTHP